jgi:hypothetical protein
MLRNIRFRNAPSVLALMVLAACSHGASDNGGGDSEGAIQQGGDHSDVSDMGIFEVMAYQQKNKFDLKKNVLFGELDYRILAGESDLQATQQLLDELNPEMHLKAKALPDGNAKVVMQAFMADDVIGCGCPSGFTDFIVNIVVESDDFPAGDTNGTAQIVPTFSITNHKQRQKSLNKKFGSPMFLGSPGFYVNDFAGNQVLVAKAAADLPKPVADPTDAIVDVGTHTVGGNFDVQNADGAYTAGDRKATFYRTKGKINSAKRAYDATADQFKTNSVTSNHATDVGAQLEFIKFKPTGWMTRETTEIARAWIP